MTASVVWMASKIIDTIPALAEMKGQAELANANVENIKKRRRNEEVDAVSQSFSHIQVGANERKPETKQKPEKKQKPKKPGFCKCRSGCRIARCACFKAKKPCRATCVCGKTCRNISEDALARGVSGLPPVPTDWELEARALQLMEKRRE